MANIKSAKKRAKQSEKHRAHNASMRSFMRTTMKKVLKAIETGNKADAEAAYKAAEPVMDRYAVKGYMSRNKAARHKSAFTARLRAMA